MLNETPETRARRLAETILDDLERDRDLLLDGRFDALAESGRALDSRIDRLAAEPEPALRAVEPQLREIRAAAARNQALLSAALRGAAAGKRRLEEIVAARARLDSYDASGAPVARAAPTLDGGRRA